MMYKEFFDEVGGFDEAYREGQGYEDNDFLWELHRQGASFEIRDDLQVNHIDTPVSWPLGGVERNAAIFNEKWKEFI